MGLTAAFLFLAITSTPNSHQPVIVPFRHRNHKGVKPKSFIIGRCGSKFLAPKISCRELENMSVVSQGEKLQTEKKDRTPIVIINNNIGAPGDSLPSYGAGTLEMLEVISLLSDSGIPSCVVGTHPLQYYGAGRVPNVSLALCKGCKVRL